ncbi:MAG: 3-ketoacyl-ACP reductase [Tannerella sp.]|jgi:NAD(P)-dependent dehydrogenase (short-subunit alcohol dehydrogenase family)|nr:3-ketoacyl-ACP reductase [Tannerella sp.]
MKRTALVTGGTRGIGYGVAKQLAADGFDVAVLGTRSEKDVNECLETLRQTGSDTLYIRGNISEADNCRSCVEKVIGKYGKIDLLVNNAGVAPEKRVDILETTEESIDRVFGINVKGTFFVSQSVAKQMIRQGKGIIINISSISAYTSSYERPEYCISKASISMMTKLFAHRLAAHGVYVYEIRPGVIKTDMTAAVSEKYDRLIAEGLFPIARWGYPEDIAKAVSALADGAFPYSTGEVINIDGGFHIRTL